MKELWIEIAQTVSPAERDNLLKLATEVCDVVLEGTQAHSHSGEGDVCVLTSLDEDKLARLKREGKKVALRISIR